MSQSLQIRRFGQGVFDAIPIMIGYLPAAIAVGAAAAQLGFTPNESALWSLIMFSGANQVLFLSGLQSGTSLIVLIFLSCLASLRHLLYGLALRKYIQTRLSLRLWFAYGLTDEVFAIASAATDETKRHAHGLWYVGLGMSALGAWVIGTWIGAMIGASLSERSTSMANALNFALPALFIALVWLSFRKAILPNLLLAAVLTSGTILLGYPSLAVPIGALAALVNFKDLQQ